MEKRCSKCGEIKDIEEFGKKARKDGQMSECKGCVSERNKRYRAENKEKIKTYSKKHYDKNREKIKTDSKIYRAENKEKISKSERIYRAENKEKIAKKAKMLGIEERTALKDTYIKQLIYRQYGIFRQDITPEMIGIQRAIILIHRKNKEVNRGIRSGNN